MDGEFTIYSVKQINIALPPGRNKLVSPEIPPEFALNINGEG